MAGLVQDCFSIGSTVVCTTCYNANIEGEVLAFDQQTKMLILKCPSASKSAKLNDVYIVNLAMCSDVQVKKEVCIVPEQPLSLNLQRLSTRARNQVEQKRLQLSALSAGASPEGQNLFMAIARTINQVTWSGPNIVVFKDVTITPPYKVDNVNCSSDQRQLSYVKKIHIGGHSCKLILQRNKMECVVIAGVNGDGQSEVVYPKCLPYGTVGTFFGWSVCVDDEFDE